MSISRRFFRVSTTTYSELQCKLFLLGTGCGDRNIFEVRSSVVGDLKVGNGCVFGANTKYQERGYKTSFITLSYLMQSLSVIWKLKSP